MKFLLSELKKTVTRRFVILLLAALLANLLLFWHGQNNGSQIYYDQDAYQTAQQDALAMRPEARLSWLQEKNSLLEVCSRWESYHEMNKMGWADSVRIDEEMLEYQQVYESGAYLEYADSLYMERQIFRTLLQEVNRITDYQATLDTAIAEAKLKTSISIFAKPGTFPYRSQLASIERLEALKKITPVYDVSEGVLAAQSAAATDLIALLLILVVCTEMIVTEQKNGMLPILRATRKGRLPLILSKAAAAFLLMGLITLVLWGTNLGYCAGTIGLGDLSRPVQSLTGYTVCTLEVSVGTYLVLFFLFKWLLYGIVGLMCLAVGLTVQSTVATWIAMGGFLSIGFILSKVISPVSAWNILKYMNVSNLIFTTDWLAEYRNLNFFGYPVEVFTACWVLTAVLLAAGLFLLCFLFCKRKIRVLPKLRLRLQWPRWLPRPGRSTGLLSHEWWKLAAECGVLLVLALFLLLNLQEPQTVAYNTDEMYYKHYMEAMTGPLTQEQDAFLEAEALRFAELRDQLRQISRDYANGLISESEKDYMQRALESALKPQSVLQNQVYPQIERLKAMQAEGKDVWVVYEPGYTYLFGMTSANHKADTAAMVLAAVILCFANFYPLETASGMLPLMNVYRRGRAHTARRKLGIGAAVTVVIYLIAQLPDYWFVIQNYGFPALQAPMCSLEVFSGWGDGVSILGGIVLFESLRLMTAISAMAVVLLVSALTRNQIASLSVSAGVLLLPILLHLLDVQLLDAFSLLRPMTASALFGAAEPLGMSLVYFGAAFLLGVLAVVLLLRYVRNGCHWRK